ncbi:unnamed protein product [Peniophora sp. CBMAI 1063]|nr:unnamed protein product [Peniophora sp. CBMAI 1063]
MLVFVGVVPTNAERQEETERLCGKLLYQAEPTITPHDLFCAGYKFTSVSQPSGSWYEVGRRFVRKRRGIRSPEVLVYTDASCWNPGTDYATAECIVAYEPMRDAPEHFNEDHSFMDIAHKHKVNLPDRTFDSAHTYVRPTSNRAKLYAAILALNKCSWHLEGWATVVIAGDLEYVVNGITDWVWRWRENGWRRADGQPVLNVDLWEFLLGRVLNLQEQGVAVKFWKVPHVKT